MSNPNSQDHTHSFQVEVDVDEDYDDYGDYDDYEDDDEQYETYHERYQDDDDTSGQPPRIFCTFCSQMIAPALYTSHIQEHIDMIRDVSLSFQSISDVTRTRARLPPLHSFLLPSMSMSSIPETRATSPAVTQSNIIVNHLDNADIQGVSFSNAFVQGSSPFVFTTRFEIQYNPLLNDSIFDDYEANIRLADLIGKVEVGVSDIEQVSKKVDKDQVNDDVSCPICMENVRQSEDIQSCRVLVCKHTYCDPCINRWLKTSKRCPVCKVDLEEKMNGDATI